MMGMLEEQAVLRTPSAQLKAVRRSPEEMIPISQDGVTM
jgi:hypothetical protein